MELLAAGVNTSVIALWLGHENVEFGIPRIRTLRGLGVPTSHY
jgi:hypothetical protein